MEHPDYELIAALEIDCGLVQTNQAVDPFTERYLDLVGRLPINRELLGISNFIDTREQRLINNCTIQPGKKWYETMAE